MNLVYSCMKCPVGTPLVELLNASWNSLRVRRVFVHPGGLCSKCLARAQRGPVQDILARCSGCVFMHGATVHVAVDSLLPGRESTLACPLFMYWGHVAQSIQNRKSSHASSRDPNSSREGSHGHAGQVLLIRAAASLDWRPGGSPSVQCTAWPRVRAPE